jgi:hypothetical protein
MVITHRHYHQRWRITTPLLNNINIRGAHSQQQTLMGIIQMDDITAAIPRNEWWEQVAHTTRAFLLMPTTSIWTGSRGSARSHTYKNKHISLAVMCTTTDESGRRSVTSNAGRLGGVSYIHSVRGPGARQ